VPGLACGLFPSSTQRSRFQAPSQARDASRRVSRSVIQGDPALRERKLQRDCKILEAELAERPDDPFVLFNLGAIAVERQDWPTAPGHLQRSLRGSAPTDSIVRKLFALIARCHQMLGDLPAALNACSEGLRIDPDDAELHFRKAVFHRKAGQPAEAEVCWRRILTLKRPDQFCSVDQGIYGHLTLRNLAVLAEERGDLVRGPAAVEDGPRHLSRQLRGHVARGSGAVNRRACRQTASAQGLSFSQGGIKRHRQSRSDNETALLWQRGGAFALGWRVESTALTLLITGDRSCA